MKFHRRILGHLFFFYSALVFLLSMLLIAIPAASFSYLFKEPKRSHITHPAYKFWISIFFLLILCPVRRKGRKNFEKGKNYVVVVNHNSFLDIPVSAPWIPGP